MKRVSCSVVRLLHDSRPSRSLAGLIAGCFLLLGFHGVARASTSVTTYHNDPQRTGWNPVEQTLTPANVKAPTFGLIASTPLDDQVDAQPLVVANQTIAGQGVHTVVYVATENNSVYAIGGVSGTLLKKVNLGAPVPTPPCGINFSLPHAGILSTPTIDVGAQTIYLVAETLVNGQPVYKLHGLNLQTLADIPGSPVTVTASHPLADGTPFTFKAIYQRQRPALLESGGNIYVAFGAYCDAERQTSRGWLLGWKAGTLASLNANELTDTLQSTAPFALRFYLSSIWMSGAGVAADGLGNLFFTTGNSDDNQPSYTGTTNIPESVVELPASLMVMGNLNLFTPSNEFTLDQNDYDYAAGGVLVLPNQPGPVPHLAVAAGKDGRLFILNRDNMGWFHTPDIPAHVTINACWCAESYYKGSNGVGRVVTSGGNLISGGDSQSQAMTWTVNTAHTPALTHEASSPTLALSSQDPGFFTSVSSNGTTPNTAIIWAIGRPTGSDKHVTLYAFNGTASNGTLTQLWSGSAGFWPNTQGNANLVPTVANGRVYVASYGQLAIFGLRAAAVVGAEAKLQVPPTPPAVKPPGALFWGTVRSINGPRLVLVLRTGKLLMVDLSYALKEGTIVVPIVGSNVAVSGKLNAQGVLEARIIGRAKGRSGWGADAPK